MAYDIKAQFTFSGHIPDGSTEDRLAVVLGVDDRIAKYCCCTSKQYNFFDENDIVRMKENSAADLLETKDVYMYISEKHISDMYLIALNSKLGNMYDVKEPLSNAVYAHILMKINNSNNLSVRFKRDFFKFLEWENDAEQ